MLCQPPLLDVAIAGQRRCGHLKGPNASHQMVQRLGINSDQNVDANSPSNPPVSPPLVIVTEGGRHSTESRRIVRAQAARASAAQSRVTRARNREEREGTAREEVPPARSSGTPQSRESSSSAESTRSPIDLANRPLVVWLSSVLNISVAGLAEYASRSARTGSPPSLNGVQSPTMTTGASFGPFLDSPRSRNDPRPQLPLAIPRGFITLQQRIYISDGLMALLSRTSCFDFDSTGVQERLQQLLLDLVTGLVFPALSGTATPDHPLHGHLRIACTCLTIFQSQRADGAAFANNDTYQRGLDAAWSEALLLDQNALREPQSAEAALWAIFIIHVTTRSTAHFLRPLLHALFEGLQIQNWAQLRGVLLDFIYPVSVLDEPCRMFYESML